ncbi:glucose--fructose oxidoreductase isoform X5 [Gossypium hirsutum]|uniref:Glucose--fructose oxidoreductase isoform X5 n=1 Tax=Gossypium hirsutum TaxID=3635 RepID=A0A1U8ILY8_GOSHI|nr:glucose--fructose oxidoreductase isoform X5 [Gossypium hirsutum]
MATLPQIAVLEAGIFVKTQYIPRLAEISHLFCLKYIWSCSEESSRGAVEIAKQHFPGVECKWGDQGLNDIVQDSSLIGTAVVLAGQVQVDISLKLLKAGKHVIQEKPAATSIPEIETALASYKSVCTNPGQPIWAVAENYRFEPAFVESKKLVAGVGDMMNVQVIIEGSMNSSNPYFSSSWRRNFEGGFILDMGVHFIAGLRMNFTLELEGLRLGNYTIAFLSKLENGCSGVFVMVVSSSSPKIIWRVVGSKGTVQVERGKVDGKHGYLVSLYSADGQCKSTFHPFCGVHEELKFFIHDIVQANLKQGNGYEAEPRSSFVEGARDVAVLEAMLESGSKGGTLVNVKKF